MPGRILLALAVSLLFEAALPAEELLVFAAASLTEALEEIGASWTPTSGETVIFSFAGSSTLARQIEALVLAALGALVGTMGGAALCRALSDFFPYGLVVSRTGLAWGWGSALALAALFGLYPALRAAKLSPMAAMR